ncbi:hypothetical protein BOTBODRAFT_177870 [Botryobasidium botryosum FD-172 SS1]|uniref:Uncharacterized protein n=1 Tax=Botryobasidium botryosum (strain FD-172 SS1) TaxID=930990 RepID=A0A067M4W3_BOTB1|nr:hypothetical protein BOTBODRAFT_177870 [Botryobasidium botryosum FD-172 SS1]
MEKRAAAAAQGLGTALIVPESTIPMKLDPVDSVSSARKDPLVLRLHKQQRIRDLEARVEILSGPKDETCTQLHIVLQHFMQGNQTLRNFKELTSFIGNRGLSRSISRRSWEIDESREFINRAGTGTAFDR